MDDFRANAEVKRLHDKYDLQLIVKDRELFKAKLIETREELERANARHAYAQDEVDRLKTELERVTELSALIQADFLKKAEELERAHTTLGEKAKEWAHSFEERDRANEASEVRRLDLYEMCQRASRLSLTAESETLRCEKYLSALKALWEAEHYEYCGQQFSETDEVVQPCKSVDEHIARELAALKDGGET